MVLRVIICESVGILASVSTYMLYSSNVSLTSVFALEKYFCGLNKQICQASILNLFLRLSRNISISIIGQTKSDPWSVNEALLL